MLVEVRKDDRIITETGEGGKLILVEEDYIVIKFSGRTRYLDAVNGSQYEPARILVGKIEANYYAEGINNQKIMVTRLLEFPLR